MKIIGFPIDVSRSQDGRIVRGLRTRQSLIQATLDLIQAGDVEPTSAAIATIAGVSSRALFQHFTSLADLYAAAFDLAVSRAFDRSRPVEIEAPLSTRIELLVSDRSELFEEWLPVWHFAERVRSVVGGGNAYLSFDIDALDPAFAPGTGTPEIGGLATWQTQTILRRLGGVNFVGMDVVEVSPPYDVAEITALAAATVAYEYLSLVANA